MEARVLVIQQSQITMKRILNISVLISIGVCTSTSINAQTPEPVNSRQEIRFYKKNKDESTQKIRFTKRKARKPGCHNFIKKIRLHRTVQFAYQQCQVFTKKECVDDSVLSFYKIKEPDLLVTELSQGYGWYPVGEHPRGQKVKSWHCE